VGQDGPGPGCRGDDLRAPVHDVTRGSAMTTTIGPCLTMSVEALVLALLLLAAALPGGVLLLLGPTLVSSRCRCRWAIAIRTDGTCPRPRNGPFGPRTSGQRSVRRPLRRPRLYSQGVSRKIQ
jgi:hypothetical protein